VFKLNKALYGLKQAPRAWNKRIDKFFIEQGFKKCLAEHGVYMKGSKETSLLIICLYVDDLMLTGSNMQDIEEFKSVMKSEFEMTDLGKLAYFLGMEYLRASKGLILHQTKYAAEILKKFNMLDCNSSITPADANIRNEVTEEDEGVDPTMFRMLIGSLRYLCQTRPDISYSVGIVSRFMSNPHKTHFLAAKKILRYINGTIQYGILFPKAQETEKLSMIGYSDADWRGDKIDRRSTTGFVFMLQGVLVSWSSKKQSIAALSSCEAEYVAGSSATCQANWFQNVLEELIV